jgi:Cof subfamily protein (haloacid dehalogenase superfamily)
LDLDGTVLDGHGQIPDANYAAIARAIDAGVEVAIATGRRYEFARPIVERLPAPLTLILSNGAIVKRHDGQTMMRRLLPRAVARAVLGHTSEHRACAAIIFDRPMEGQVIFEAIDWSDRRHRLFYEANRQFVSERSPLVDALTEDPVQLMFTGACAAMRGLFDRLRAAAPSELGTASREGGAYSVSLTEYGHRDFSLVDVMQAGCSKGSALAAWAERQDLSPSEVMAVGDNLNDLEMLEFAGTPVLMGNAIDDLKTRGWAVTATNDEAGVARAIETFVLAEASKRPASDLDSLISPDRNDQKIEI